MAGGIEWNVGVRGHGAFTSDKLFAATLEGPDGEPILRVWEYERTRKLVFQMDFFLCGNEPRLAVHIGVHNPTDQVVPLYWWSNVAVREQPGSRVVAHGSDSICHAYGGHLGVLGVDAPQDLSALKNHKKVGDYFYFGHADERPWVSAVQADGYGLYQTSTSAQQGRKLFAWGPSLAARNWQKMLSHEAIPYFEIQAGVAPTQYGSERLQPGKRIEWIETYGPLQVDPQIATQGAPGDLRRAAADRIEQSSPADQLESLLLRQRATFDRVPDTIIQMGAGWGALELRIGAQGDHWKGLPGAVFPADSLSGEQRPWLEVLAGRVPELHPDHSTPGYMIDGGWLERLEAASGPETAWSQLHRGIMAYAAGETEQAKNYFEGSLELVASAVAHVCLLQLHRNAEQPVEALHHAREAMALEPDDARVQVMLANALVEAGDGRGALQHIKGVTGSKDPQDRLRMAAIAAHIQVGELAEAKRLLADAFTIPDLREAESKLGQLWKLLHEGDDSGEPIPSPEHLIFVADPNLMPAVMTDCEERSL
jgi:tetratricopeptide (TPR) repeat protein